MHTADAASDLRQGDICALPNVPIWNVNRSSTMTGGLLEGIVLPNWDKIAQIDDQYLVAVCTQCCDIENPRARTGVAIAPLMKVPARPGDDRHESIMGSWQQDVLGRYEYVNLFPLRPPIAELPAVVADFSAIITMAPMEVATDRLLRARRFSLEPDERTAFREKLAFMFGRDPEARAPDFR